MAEAGGNWPLATSHNGHELLTEILVNLLPNDQQCLDLFSQACELRTMQLGDELVNYNLLDRAEEVAQPTPNFRGFYLVCQGRVRLVGLDQTQQTEVSVGVLEVGDSWGADEQFCESPLPYRAIAASSGLIATLSIAKLEPWLKQLPSLRNSLDRITQARQKLIFFKLATALRTQSSHILKRLLPYLTEIQIPAGANLAQATPTATGRFWLRQGQIQAQEQNPADRSDPALPPATIGDTWGYPDPVPADWVAVSDLWVYQLAIDHWEVAQGLVPALVVESSQTSETSHSNSVKGIQRPVVCRRSFTPPLPGFLPFGARHLMATSSYPPAASKNRQQARSAFLSETTSVEFAKPSPVKQHRWFGQRYPFIAQQSTSDCGITCLAMIAQYWGKRFSLNMLRTLAGVGRSGVSLKGLGKAAEDLGFLARPVRSSFNRLAEQTTPWIAHWQGDHYVVVYRIKRNRVILADPAFGRRSLRIPEFQASWTGYALLLTPTGQLQAIPSAKPSLGRFWGAVWPYRSMLWAIILASVLLQILGLVAPLFTQIILDQVVVHKSMTALNVFIMGLLLFGIWRVALVCIRQYFVDYFSNQVDLTLISGFISHALNLPLQFFATRHVGDIVTRVQENHKIQLFLTRQAFAAWLDAIMAVVYVGLMLHYNWHLTGLVLSLLPPIIAITVIASPFLRRVSRQIFHESAQQNSALVEMLTGITTVKMSAAERDLRWQWEDHLTNQFNAQFRGQKLANGLQAISELINTLGSTALLWYGATLVIQDQLSIGQLVAFNMMIGNVVGPVLALVGFWDELQEVMVSVERLDDVFSAQPEESADHLLLTLPRIRGEVCFENVTFRYHPDDDRNILQNISFQVRPGETVAIVGRSGSGKTTLVSLLQGLYHPTSGRITIDSHDLRHVSPQSLRQQLGVVPQECFLFSGTILDNITLYRPEYPLEAVIEVAKLAEAHTFIQNLPLGYETKVGERGTLLSGGQRQRIAIARALLSTPRILILDEATSSLDVEAERRFQDNLQRISRDRTTFIIAHRLATVRHADCILVLDRGLIVEQGTHRQLMEKRGLYAQLAQQQLDV